MIHGAGSCKTRKAADVPAGTHDDFGIRGEARVRSRSNKNSRLTT